MKRVRTWLKNRDMAAERKSNIMTDLIQRYYWIDRPRRLVDDIDSYVPESPTIEIDGKEYDGRSKSFKKLKTGEKSSLLVTREMLEAELYVDVYTNDAASSSKAIQKENTLDFMKSLPTLVNSYVMAQQAQIDLTSIMPVQETVEELAKNFNITVKSKTVNKELQNKAEELKAQLKSIAQNVGVDTNNLPDGNPMKMMMAGTPASQMPPVGNPAAPAPTIPPVAPVTPQ